MAIIIPERAKIRVPLFLQKVAYDDNNNNNRCEAIAPLPISHSISKVVRQTQ